MRNILSARVVPILCIASLLIFFWGLGSIPLLSFNEARRAVPIREMITSGDWLVPTLDGQLYITKPPLFYWLAALPALLFNSTSEWIVRLPSAIAALATAWLLALSMRRHFGREAALFTVLVLITSAGYTMFARRSEIEMLLTACCFGSVLAAFEFMFSNADRRWLNAAFVFLALALLAKGPVALLFYVPVLLVFWLLYREPKALVCLMHWRGWLLALLIALPWYLLVSQHLGWDIWHRVIATDIAGKVSDARPDPFYQYPVWLLGDFLPWIVLALATLRASLPKWQAAPKRAYFVIAALLPLLIFSLIASKHAKYLLPAYPAWAAVLGLAANDAYARFGAQGRRWLLDAAAILVICVFTYFAAIEPRVLKHRFTAFPKIAAAIAPYPDTTLLTLGEVDPRMVYFRGKPTLAISQDELVARLRANESVLLFVEDEVPTLIDQKMCLIERFEPYLRHGHSASLLGAGSACSASATKN